MPRGSVSPQAIASEADAVGFLAEILADWTSGLNPLSVQAALDQLASRLTTGGSHPVSDDTDLVKGSVDATKLLRIEVDGLTTGTTRTITMADQDVNLTPDSGTYPAFATAVALAVAL